jgi:AraC-like DNA-binding protein
MMATDDAFMKKWLANHEHLHPDLRPLLARNPNARKRVHRLQAQKRLLGFYQRLLRMRVNNDYALTMHMVYTTLTKTEMTFERYIRELHQEEARLRAQRPDKSAPDACIPPPVRPSSTTARIPPKKNALKARKRTRWNTARKRSPADHSLQVGARIWELTECGRSKFKSTVTRHDGHNKFRLQYKDEDVAECRELTVLAYEQGKWGHGWE